MSYAAFEADDVALFRMLTVLDYKSRVLLIVVLKIAI